MKADRWLLRIVIGISATGAILEPGIWLAAFCFVIAVTLLVYLVVRFIGDSDARRDAWVRNHGR